MPVCETTGQSELEKPTGFATIMQQTFPENQPWLRYTWGLPTMAKTKGPEWSSTHAYQFEFN